MKSSVIDIEQSLIGALLLSGASPDAFEVTSSLPIEALTNGAHRKFYKAITKQLLTDNLIDPVLITDGMSHEESAILAEYAKNCFSSANLKGYAAHLAEEWRKRQIIDAVKSGWQLLSNANTGEATEFAIADIMAKISAAQESNKSITPIDTNDLLENYIDVLESRNQGKTSALTFDMEHLDEQTSGVEQTDLVILAARPSMGKTELSLAMARHAAKKGGVLVFSMEMSAMQIIERDIAAEGNLEVSSLKRAEYLRDEDWAKISSGISRLQEGKSWVVDATNLTVEQIRSVSEAHKRKHPELKAIFIDYLGLIKKPKAERNDLAIAHISSSLKALAKQLKTPVIALSQLSRDVEKRPNKRPINSDLRDSGSVEQDADLIIMLYRDEYYNKDSKAKNIAEVIVTKNRNGKTGTVYVEFKNGHFYDTDQVSAQLKSEEREPMSKRYGGRRESAF